MNCSLCFIPKEQQYRVIYENENIFVCVCLDAMTDSHLMILPKRHVTKLDDLTADESKMILVTVEKMSILLKRKFNTKGSVTLMNHHELKSQDHIHFHMVASDSSQRDFVTGYLKVPARERQSPEKLKQIADEIKKAL